MEVKSICIMCCCPQNCQTNLEPERNVHIFTRIAENLNINFEHVAENWNFEKESLPFCDLCLIIAYKLEKLYRELDDLELQIAEYIEEFKSSIKCSVKRNLRSTRGLIPFTSTTYSDSARFDNFRDLVLKSNKLISTGRLASVTGIPAIKNDDDDSMSQSSIQTTFSLVSLDGNEIEHELELICGGQQQLLNKSDQDFIDELTSGISSSTSVETTPPCKWIKRDDEWYFGDVKIISNSLDIQKTSGWGCSKCDYTIPPDKKSPWKKTLANHIRQKHFIRCHAPRCLKTFGTSKSLEDHIEKDHSQDSYKNTDEIKILTCKTCKHRCKNLSLLRNHECNIENSNENSSTTPSKKRKISPKKQFICDICDKIFDKKFNMERHKEGHTSLLEQRKDSICENCGKNFTRHGLTEHLRLVHKIGTEVPELKCSAIKCKKVFPTKSRLKNHTKKMHGK